MSRREGKVAKSSREWYDRPPHQMTMDRFIPGAHNGTYDPNNIVHLLCVQLPQVVVLRRGEDFFAILDALAEAEHIIDEHGRMQPHPEAIRDLVLGDGQRTPRDDEFILPSARGHRRAMIDRKRRRLAAQQRPVAAHLRNRQLPTSAPPALPMDDESDLPSLNQLVALTRSRYVGRGRYLDDSGAVLPLRLASVDRIDGSLRHSDDNLRLLAVGLNLVRGHTDNNERVGGWLDGHKRRWPRAQRQWGGTVPGANDWDDDADFEAIIDEQVQLREARDDADALEHVSASIGDSDVEAGSESDGGSGGSQGARPAAPLAAQGPPNAQPQGPQRQRRPQRPQAPLPTHGIFGADTRATLGGGHCAPDAVGMELSYGEWEFFDNILVRRSMAVRGEATRWLEDPPDWDILPWLTPERRERPLQRLWPGGVMPAPGSDEWRAFERVDEEQGGSEEAQWFDAIILAIVAEVYGRPIAVDITSDVWRELHQLYKEGPLLEPVFTSTKLIWC